MNTPTPQTPLKALIFDVDGTLSDTERDGHRVAFNQALMNTTWAGTGASKPMANCLP